MTASEPTLERDAPDEVPAEVICLPASPCCETAWRGEMTAELRHLRVAVAGVQEDVRELRGEVTEELRAHRRYHELNEARWGPLRWCERHPLRLCLAVVLVVSVMGIPARNADWQTLAQTLMQYLLQP